jgi:hypothetical protein
MIRRNFAIGADFPVVDMHTVYEWCMIYTDRDPGVAAMDATAEAQRERLQYLGAIGSNAVLVTADTSIMIADTTGRRVTPGRRTEKVDISLHYRISNAVYQKLAKDIETGKLEPERPVYLDDRPNELDPTLCVIGVAPILKMAKRRGDGGQVIRRLLVVRHHAASSITPSTPQPPTPAPFSAPIATAAPAAAAAAAPGQPAVSPRRRRGAYIGALSEWMARMPIDTLRRMTPDAIAREFKVYCERERPELLPLLPKRLRSMHRIIERIIEGRVEAAKAAATTPRATRRQ